jgi:hypothetical protein
LEFFWPPFYYFPGTRNSRSAASNCWWNVKRHTQTWRDVYTPSIFLLVHIQIWIHQPGCWERGRWAIFPPGKEPEMPRIQEAVIPPQLTLGYEWILCRFLYFVVSRLLLGYPVDARESDLSSSLAEWFIRVAASYR